MAGAAGREDVIGARALAGGVEENDGVARLEVEFALEGLGGELGLSDAV